MDTFLAIAAIICGVVGIIGAIAPIIPGTILSFAGLVLAYCTEHSSISEGTLWIWGIISIIVIALDYILPGYFSKVFGGTKAGITGATIGVLIGAFVMGPIGIIMGPFVGAVVGEMIKERRALDKALVVGFGSLLSFFVGTGIKLIAAGWMMYYIRKDLFELIKSIV